MNGAPQPRPLSIYLVAAEESGDALGAALIRALVAGAGRALTLAGVGGRAMAEAGIVSPFPIDDLAIIGFSAIPARLPMILRRIRETADAVVAARPDALVIIDTPDFNHRVARRAGDPHPRLCFAIGLGLAARAGACHARLCRSRTRHPAVRAGCAPTARRTALRLCRPSADRVPFRAAPG
jgi:hypothetical protein